MFSTEQRKNSKSAFEKDFFKLMNNSVYEKTMENIRNRVDVQLVNDEKKAQKLVAALTFKRFKIFDNELVGVERWIKKCLTLDKPIYVGFVILELSKLIMYNFHYNVMKKEYGDKAELLFTDTDSLTYEVETEDIYEDMSRHMDIYDTSDYPRDHFLLSESNKKKIGCFKDELHSKPIFEFIGLRPKMYSIKSVRGEKKTAKEVVRSVVERNIRHEDYRRCRDELKSTREIQHRIQSENHKLKTVTVNKIALCAFDDKRYLLDDNVHMLAHGHYKI
ncbi:hypothetical protein AVEN_252410-1 [Araneus ventricosus]|uniref:DNA-directed DNA polymerase n=1 Tax=Araneus ventricosus TaxID=182803 RepID=A0A4Y2ATB3_ARAVE|nr:hypothetical protein AVEN_252410-1 [Araneus ventricosus]